MQCQKTLEVTLLRLDLALLNLGAFPESLAQLANLREVHLPNNRSTAEHVFSAWLDGSCTRAHRPAEI